MPHLVRKMIRCIPHFVLVAAMCIPFASSATTVKALSFAILGESGKTGDRNAITNYIVGSDIDFGAFDFSKSADYFVKANFSHGGKNYKVSYYSAGTSNTKFFIWNSDRYELVSTPYDDRSSEKMAAVFEDACGDQYALISIRGTYSASGVNTYVGGIATKYPGAKLIVTYNARVGTSNATTLDASLTTDPAGPQMTCLGRTDVDGTAIGGVYMYPSDVPSTYSVSLVPTNSIGSKYDGTLATLEVPTKYKVIFNDYDGTGIQTNVVLAGESVTPPTPVRSGYNFVGWDHDDSEFSSVSESFTATAQYELAANSHSVRFLDEDGETLVDEVAVTDGAAMTPPDPPVHVGRHFVAWLLNNQAYDLETPVTKDIVLVASYAVNFYNVTFLDWNGSQLGEVQSVEHGHSATEPELPEIPAGKVFWKWSEDFSSVTGPVETQAALADALTEIDSGAAFAAAIVEGAASASVYRLTADIVLDSWSAVNFSATLDGAGHTLSGLGASSLFVTNSGTVANLTLDGTDEGTNTICKAGVNSGMFCDVAEGAVFTNCVIKGYTLRESTLNGSFAGLFAGTAYDGTSFYGCTIDEGCAVISAGANVTVGGFVARLSCQVAEGTAARFVDCTNNAPITATTGDYSAKGKGGFVGQVSGLPSASNPDVVFLRCANNGAVTSLGSNVMLGGFVGYYYGNSSSKADDCYIRFTDCANTAEVAVTNGSGSVGGFIATVSTASVFFNRCANRGNITSGSTASGFVADLGGYGKTKGDGSVFLNSANYGDVTGNGTAAGFVGSSSWNEGWQTGRVYVRNCATYGTISSTNEIANVGEIMGRAVSGTGSGVAFVFENTWTRTSTLYTSSSKTPTVTGNQAADAEGYDPKLARRALDNAVVVKNEDEDAGWERWGLGRLSETVEVLKIVPELAPLITRAAVGGTMITIR